MARWLGVPREDVKDSFGKSVFGSKYQRYLAVVAVSVFLGGKMPPIRRSIVDERDYVKNSERISERARD